MFNKQCSVVADVDVGLIKLLSLIESCRVLRKTNPMRKLSLSVAWKINRAHTLPFIARHGVYPLACFYQLEPSTLQLLGIDNDIWFGSAKHRLSGLPQKTHSWEDLACRFVCRDLRRTWDNRRSHWGHMSHGVNLRGWSWGHLPRRVYSSIHLLNIS